MLDIDDTALQSAWWVLNDIYRSVDLCLVYPPHVLALAAVYLAFAMNPPPDKPVDKATPAASTPVPAPVPPSRAAAPAVPPSPTLANAPKMHPSLPAKPHPSLPSRPQFATATAAPTPPVPAPTPAPPPAAVPSPPVVLNGGTDPVAFLASTNVSLPLVLEAVQQIVAFYALWRSYNAMVGAGGPSSPGSPQPAGSTPPARQGGGRAVSAVDETVVACLLRMRDERNADIAHPSSAGAPTASGRR